MTDSSHEYSFSQALELVDCSESTLRRKLNEQGSSLGATKLKRGWRIPVTTLEALGVLKTVTGHVTGHDRSDETITQTDGLQAENTRLRIEIATLRAENDGLKKLLA
ncbi:bZIP transcription factor, partial [Bifidobacterium panos]